jgi:site-specific DNA recombinase
MTTKKAVLYARVSTDDQADKGYSLPSQFEAMRKYAAQQGFEIVAEYQDDYSGATPIEHRPEGRKAYTLLQSGAADAIIAYTIDRFVRPPEDGDEWEMPILIRGLAKLGKEIHTVRRGKLNTSFADLLIALLDARKAGEERRDIRERSMRGKRAKVKLGRVIGMRAPYGYRHIRDEHGKVVTFKIDETTARIVRLIFKWYVVGDEHGKTYSFGEIARQLSEMRATTPGEIGRGYKRKRGKGIWSQQTVMAILTNEVYAGVWRYGMQIGDTKRRRPLEETVAVDVPAIIDRTMWEQAQARRTYNKRMSLRNCKRQYLLRGMIQCTCGYWMSGECEDKIRRLYSCNARRHIHISIEDIPCNGRKVRADAIEADIWGEIRELFQDLERLGDDLKRAQQNEEDTLAPIRERLKIADDFIKQAEREAVKIANALKDAEKGGAVYKALKKDETEVNTQLADLAKQREKIIAELGTRKITDAAIETIMEYARKVRKGIDGATFEVKRRILETLDVQVTVDTGQYRDKWEPGRYRKGLPPGKYHLMCILGEKDGIISQIKRGGARIVPDAS